MDISATASSGPSSLTTPLRSLLSLPLDARRELTNALLWSLPRDDVIALNTRISLMLQKDIVGRLPPELAVLILARLEVEDILRCGLVSRAWARICTEQRLWALKCSSCSPPIRPRKTTWADLALHQQLLHHSLQPRPTSSFYGADEGSFESGLDELSLDATHVGGGMNPVWAQGGMGGGGGVEPLSLMVGGMRGPVWERSGSGLPTHAHASPSGSTPSPRRPNRMSTGSPRRRTSLPSPQAVLDVPKKSDLVPPSALALPTATPQVNYKHLYIAHHVLARRLRQGLVASFRPFSFGPSYAMHELGPSRAPNARSFGAISSVEAGGLPGHSEAIYCLQILSCPLKVTVSQLCPDCRHASPSSTLHPFTYSGLGSRRRPSPVAHDHTSGPDPRQLEINGRDWLMTGSRDHTLRLWQLSTPSPKVVKIFHGGHTGSVLSFHVVAVPLEPHLRRRPTGSASRRPSTDQSAHKTRLMAVSAGSDGAICLWDVENGDGKPQKVNRDHSDSVMYVRADDERVVSCSKDKTIRVFDIHTLEQLLVIDSTVDDTRHRGAINAVSLSKEYIISASGDKTIRVWDIHTGALLAGIEAASRGISALDFELPTAYTAWQPRHPGSVLKGTIVAGASDATIKTFHLVSHSHAALDIVDALDIVPPLPNMTFHEMLLDEDDVTMAPESELGEGDAELRIEQATKCWASCVCPQGLAKPDSMPCGRCYNRGHTDLVRSLQLGPEVILSGSYDSTVKASPRAIARFRLTLQVWDRATGKLLADLARSPGGRVFAVAGDKLRIVSSGLDSRLTIWNVSDGLDTAFIEP